MESVTVRADAERTIQEMIAQGESLGTALAAICAMIEQQVPEALTSIMLFDRATQTLSFQAGSRLPADYCAAARDLPIGPEEAICGSAAFHRSVIASEDILTDPRCAKYWDLARKHQLRAGWSYPLLTSDDRLVGTFALYYRTPQAPPEWHREPVERAAALATLAIVRHQDWRAVQKSEERFRSLFTHNPDAVFSLDRSGALNSVNHAASEITGLSEARLIGMHYSDFVVASDRERTSAAFEQARGGKPQRYEIEIIDAVGTRRFLDVTNLPIMVDGEVAGVYGIAKDVTLRKEQETQLRTLQRSVENSVNGIVIADAKAADMPIIYANVPFLRMTGYGLEEVIGRNCRFLHGPDTDHRAIAIIHQRLAKHRDVRVTLLNYRKDGTTFWNDMFVSPVADEAGQITHFVGIQHDVSTQKAHEASLAYQASHEPLTGLPNRGLLEERLNREYALAQRRNGLLAVLFIDLDDFKPINDTLGHTVGDRLLKAVARRLSTILEAGDTLAGVGGDEFIILLPGREAEEQILAVTERALTLLDKPYCIDGHEIHVTGSIGIATNGMDVDQPIELIQHADMAMYLAKREGRNTYHQYTHDITVAMNEQVSLRHELHEAIEAGDFELHYQPLVNATTGEVESFEALIRWHNPVKGLISPAKFIPLAEQTGQIIAIGEWVLKRACRDLAALNQLKGTTYPVAINVSPLQFHGRNFLTSLNKVLEQTGLPAHQLNIELTEGVLMENVDSTLDILRTLRGMGIDVFIDDFGTGYSSLSYLKHLPINKVKIDRTFTREIVTSSHDAAIAQGIITMAHHLGLKVVAEGIEVEAQRLFLADRGCDQFQGFLFARPMPMDDLQHYLTARDHERMADTDAG